MKDQNRSEVSSQRDKTKELRTQQAKQISLSVFCVYTTWKKNTDSDLASELGSERELNLWES